MPWSSLNYDYYGSSTTTWNFNTSANVFVQPVVTISFLNLLERDRFHLLRAKPCAATPLSTPTTKAPVALTLIERHRRSGHGSRWERSPLNKRAIAKR